MNARGLCRTLVGVAFAAAFLAPAAPIRAAAAAAPSGVTLECRPATISANEEGSWRFAVLVRNATDRGVYGDSLVLTIRPDGGAAPVRTRLVLPKSAETMSAGDSLASEILVNASAPRARLEVDFHWHGTGGGPLVASGSIVAAGSVLEDAWPARIARVSGRDVEMRRIVPGDGVATVGGVLLLPGEGLDPREVLVPAARLAGLGLAVVVVGAPGRGRTQGGDDLAGAASRAAALAGLDTLLRLPGVDPARVGVWGISRGGTLALELALERPAAFRAVAAQSASYDQPVTRRAASFKPALLVLHGEKDAVHPAAPAHAFGEAVKAAGGEVVTRFLPQGGHALAFAEAARFLGLRLTAGR